jgi:hypothetical protein
LTRRIAASSIIVASSSVIGHSVVPQHSRSETSSDASDNAVELLKNIDAEIQALKELIELQVGALILTISKLYKKVFI